MFVKEKLQLWEIYKEKIDKFLKKHGGKIQICLTKYTNQNIKVLNQKQFNNLVMANKFILEPFKNDRDEYLEKVEKIQEKYKKKYNNKVKKIIATLEEARLKEIHELKKQYGLKK